MFALGPKADEIVDFQMRALSAAGQSLNSIEFYAFN